MIAALVFWVVAKDSPFWWIWIIPAMLLILTFIILAIGLILGKLGFFNPRYALVNHKRVRSCLECSAHCIKPNPINAAMPICKCEDNNMKTNYSPGKVPRWCPHVCR